MKHGLPCILALIAPIASAAWINIGPSGGVARFLAGDATGATVYAINPRNGVFRSAGGGAWARVFDAHSRAVTMTAIAVDAKTSRVYAGTSAGLYRSDDDGASWSALNGEVIVAVDASLDRVIISTLAGMARSNDAGLTWTTIGSPPSDVLTQVALLRIDPRNPMRVAAAIAGNLFLSDDFGDSWQQLNAANVVSATFGDSLYAGGSSGVFTCSSTCTLVSSDPVVDVAYWRGQLFRGTPTGVVPGAVIFSLFATPSTLFAGTTAGVYATDDGARWTNRSDGLTNVRVAGLAIAAGSLFAATRGQGILRLKGGWINTSSDLPIATTLASDGSTLYAGFSDGGLFRSSDLGATWIDISAGLPSRTINDIAAASSKVIVTTAAGVMRSTDRGATWQSFDLGHTPRHVAIAGSRIYVATEQGLFVVGGAGPFFAGSRINALTAAGNRAYVSITASTGSDAASGIYFSDDAATWVFVNGSDALPNDITALAADSVFLYAATDGESIFATPLLRRRVIKTTEEP